MCGLPPSFVWLRGALRCSRRRGIRSAANAKRCGRSRPASMGCREGQLAPKVAMVVDMAEGKILGWQRGGEFVPIGSPCCPFPPECRKLLRAAAMVVAMSATAREAKRLDPDDREIAATVPAAGAGPARRNDGKPNDEGDHADEKDPDSVSVLVDLRQTDDEADQGHQHGHDVPDDNRAVGLLFLLTRPLRGPSLMGCPTLRPVLAVPVAVDCRIVGVLVEAGTGCNCGAHRSPPVVCVPTIGCGARSESVRTRNFTSRCPRFLLLRSAMRGSLDRMRRDLPTRGVLGAARRAGPQVTSGAAR